ncbi:MAG: SDR family oxidoreductase [Burkholderiaceae bacterium]|nr:SDR family oxidoreductase [Burkholderiaceae bacterium]
MAKVLIVTGGSRGIGAATARLAAAAGYTVCVNYRNDHDAAAQVVASLHAMGVSANSFQADVSVEEDVVRMFEHVDSSLGRVDALVNNAGILGKQCRVEEMDAERVARTLSINVVGAFVCCREAVRRMSTRYGGMGGAIVNVSSRAAQLGSPGEYVDYAASKAALDTLTIGLAKEVAADGIRVNAVAAGIIYTDIHTSGGEPGRVDRLKGTIPMQRGGTADEVASAILWLLSDGASYTTGTVLHVSGGR